jgi:hypothetical protein
MFRNWTLFKGSMSFFKLLELIIPLSLAYLGWAIGDKGRLTLSGMSSGDFADAFISLLLTYFGFFYLKSSVRKNLDRTSQRAIYLFKDIVLLYLIVFLIFVFSYRFFFQTWWDSSFFAHTTPLFLLFSTIVIGYFFIRGVMNRGLEPDQANGQIIAHWHIGKRVVSLGEVVLFLSKGKQTYLFLNDGGELRIDDTLQKCLDALSKEEFFRANRQFIVARKYVKGYSNEEHQKLRLFWSAEVLIEPPVVIVSKVSAPVFKKWIKTRSTY